MIRGDKNGTENNDRAKGDKANNVRQTHKDFAKRATALRQSLYKRKQQIRQQKQTPKPTGKNQPPKPND